MGAVILNHIKSNKADIFKQKYNKKEAKYINLENISKF